MERFFFPLFWQHFFELERNSTALKFHILSIFFTALKVKYKKLIHQKLVSFFALDCLEMLTLKYIEWKDWKEIDIE